MRFHYTLVRMAILKKTNDSRHCLQRKWRKRDSFSVGDNVHLYRHIPEIGMQILTRLKTAVLYNPKLAFLAIYLQDTKTTYSLV